MTGFSSRLISCTLSKGPNQLTPGIMGTVMSNPVALALSSDVLGHLTSTLGYRKQALVVDVTTPLFSVLAVPLPANSSCVLRFPLFQSANGKPKVTWKCVYCHDGSISPLFFSFFFWYIPLASLDWKKESAYNWPQNFHGTKS